ncbi:adenylosuccinate lyase [Flavobacterium sp. CYK-55]|uniref:adenylosuccinate lyase n=1 Tax=Flavobacterium sp. CYK-55 TaxID=2835529 RepID=UPI001BD00F83|nr:adenylosuccinate lyase [Flavobacterium sp. CYK-55]MBS7787069.1 adenylosuccinate lyase [Flavobacterium sp. CYK-55]
MNSLNELSALSPIDGRYRGKTQSLAPYFSEAALMRYRVLVEVEYFISLCNLPLPQLVSVNTELFDTLRSWYENFSDQDALQIKETEKTTNHDVKAVEYFIKAKFDEIGLSQYKEFIHFGLTSQDINNTAIPLSVKEAFQEVYMKSLIALLGKLKDLSDEWNDIPMLARTHGQPASPTRLGKEIAVFIERLEEQLRLLFEVPFAAKFGGATGNFNAHHVAYPAINWKKFGSDFVETTLGLQHSFPTTQIEHYDHLAAFFDALKRINNIIIDLDRDIWTYVSMDYFKQKIKEGEVGSSAMPHKVNPIDFENSEGNLGMANALFEHLSAKLPISRLQRDLTDSTVLRNIGVPMAHTLIAFDATLKGLNKLVLNSAQLEADLEKNWAVVAEAIQTILRREGYPNPYEALKALTRTHQVMNRESIHAFIETLEVSAAVKNELLAITPSNYLGI